MTTKTPQDITLCQAMSVNDEKLNGIYTGNNQTYFFQVGMR